MEINWEKKYEKALEKARELHGTVAAGRDFLAEIFPELRGSEDEMIRKDIIALIEFALEDGSAVSPGSNITKEEALAYLEKQKEQKPEGVYVDCTEHPDWYGMPQKPTAKVNGEPVPTENQSVDIPLVEWSEEDKTMINHIIEALPKWANGLITILPSQAEEYVKRLKSLRPQPYKEAYQAAKHDLATTFMNYLDKNRPEGKMCLSNGECKDIDKAFKENDWAKIMRYAEKYRPHWKPSEEQMEALEWMLTTVTMKDGGRGIVLKKLVNDLKKLM